MFRMDAPDGVIVELIGPKVFLSGFDKSRTMTQQVFRCFGITAFIAVGAAHQIHREKMFVQGGTNSGTTKNSETVLH